MHENVKKANIAYKKDIFKRHRPNNTWIQK